MRALGALFILIIGGCVVGPDYVRPDVSMPDQWHKDLIGNLSDHQEYLSSWWTTFDDPTLNELIERAGMGNLDARQAFERIREARAILGIATGERYPDIDAIGAYDRSRISEGLSEEIFPPRKRTDNFYQSGFDSIWEIDIWGRITRLIESTRRDMEASVEDYHDVMISLYAEMALAYVQVRSLQERIRLAENNVTAQSQTLKLTQDRFDAEIAPKLDVHQAELNLATTKAAIPTLKSGLNISMNRLGVLLGDYPTSLHAELAKPGSIPKARINISTGLPIDIIRRRPDIRRAERQLAAQTSRIGVATAQLYPEFTLTGTMSFQAVNSNDLLKAGSIGYSFGPGFRWNIFDGGRVRNQINVEDSLTAQALIEYEQTILLALEEVENAMVAYYEENQRSVELQRSVDSAKKSVELVQTLYLLGLTDFENVLVMQRSLFQQEDELANSHGRVSRNLIRLYKAIGGGWQPDTVEIHAELDTDNHGDKG